MSKELKALERIKNREILIDIGMTCTIYNECEDLHDDFDIIETTLKENQERIEELEETNHLMFIREHKNEKKLKVLDEILALHDKWLGYKMSDFEFFTLLCEARRKYDL